MAITYTRTFNPTKPQSHLGGLKTVTAKTSDYTVTAVESGTSFLPLKVLVVPLTLLSHHRVPDCISGLLTQKTRT